MSALASVATRGVSTALAACAACGTSAASSGLGMGDTSRDSKLSAALMASRALDGLGWEAAAASGAGSTRLPSSASSSCEASMTGMAPVVGCSVSGVLCASLTGSAGAAASTSATAWYSGAGSAAAAICGSVTATTGSAICGSVAATTGSATSAAVTTGSAASAAAGIWGCAVLGVAGVGMRLGSSISLGVFEI